MARGKHTTALFEVINSGKKPPGGLKSSTGRPLEGKAAAASLMRTPKWWFKGRPARDSKPDAAPTPVAAAGNDPTANVTAATLTAHRSPITPSTGSAPATAPIVPVEEPPSEPTVVVHDYSEPEPILAERFVQPEPEPAPSTDSTGSPRAGSPRVRSPQAGSPRTLLAQEPEPEPAPLVMPVVKIPASAPRRQEGMPSRSAVQFDVDRDRQEITLRMRYTTAIVSGFVVLVAIASAYVIGRRLGESASAAGGAGTIPNASTRLLKDGPAQPGVLDVGRDHARLATAKLDGSAKKPDDSDTYEDAPMDNAGIAYRTVNRNYVIIATFPWEKRDTASKALDFLCGHGITCTLERDVHGEPPHWLSIVGIRGFPHRYSDNKDYLAYRDAIIALNDKFPAKSNFGRFTALPYKWDGN